MGNQLGQVRAQRRLTASEYNVRNPQRPQLIQNRFPLLGAQFGVISGSCVIAVGAVIIAPIGQCQVHAVRRRKLRRERHHGIQFQITNWTRSIRLYKRFQLFAKSRIVRAFYRGYARVKVPAAGAELTLRSAR